MKLNWELEFDGFSGEYRYSANYDNFIFHIYKCEENEDFPEQYYLMSYLKFGNYKQCQLQNKFYYTRLDNAKRAAETMKERFQETFGY